MADVLVVNKVQTAKPPDLAAVLESCRTHNPAAKVIECRSTVSSFGLTDEAPPSGSETLMCKAGVCVLKQSWP